MTTRLAVVGVESTNDEVLTTFKNAVASILDIDTSSVMTFPKDSKPLDVANGVIPKKEKKLFPQGVRIIICDSVSPTKAERYDRLSVLEDQGLKIDKGFSTPNDDVLESMDNDDISEWLSSGSLPEKKNDDDDDDNLLSNLLGDDDDDDDESESSSNSLGDSTPTPSPVIAPDTSDEDTHEKSSPEPKKRSRRAPKLEDPFQKMSEADEDDFSQIATPDTPDDPAPVRQQVESSPKPPVIPTPTPQPDNSRIEDEPAQRRRPYREEDEADKDLDNSTSIQWDDDGEGDSQPQVPQEQGRHRREAEQPESIPTPTPQPRPVMNQNPEAPGPAPIPTPPSPEESYRRPAPEPQYEPLTAENVSQVSPNNINPNDVAQAPEYDAPAPPNIRSQDPPRPNRRTSLIDSVRNEEVNNHYGNPSDDSDGHLRPARPDRDQESEFIAPPRPDRGKMDNRDAYMNGMSEEDKEIQKRIRRDRQRHGKASRDSGLSPTKQKAKVILITGSNGGVGKSTVSWMMANTLSLAINESAKTTPVWLIETDYKNPKLQERLGIDAEEKNLGNIATAVAQRANSKVGGHKKIRRGDMLQLIEDNTYVMKETGLRILVCPYRINKVGRRFIEYAIAQAIEQISAKGGYIMLDSGTLTSKNYDPVDYFIAHQFVSKAVVVSDLGHYSDYRRACYTLDTEIGIRASDIGVLLNKAQPKSLSVASQRTAPYKLVGFFPSVAELDASYSEDLKDRAWVGEASSNVIETLKQHAGMTMLEMGIPEMKPWLDSRQEMNVSGRSFASKIFSKLFQ